MRTALSIALLLSCAAAPAAAADVRLTITDSAGLPVSDAVVSLYPAGGMPPLQVGSGYRMAQQGIQFAPRLLIVPVGATVGFPNLDRVRHQVYSFSTSKRFELKLYGRDETHSVLFDKPGTIALGCNIHDAMAAFIRVVDTPFTARSAADGTAKIAGLGAGPIRVLIWHPRLKGRANELESRVVVPAAGLRQTIMIPVRAG